MSFQTCSIVIFLRNLIKSAYVQEWHAWLFILQAETQLQVFLMHQVILVFSGSFRTKVLKIILSEGRSQALAL